MGMGLGQSKNTHGLPMSHTIEDAINGSVGRTELDDLCLSAHVG